MRLLLFNPETEYALASGASFYTPPIRVEKLRKELQLLPEAWAEKDDYILVDDVSLLASKCRLVDWNMLESLFEEKPELKIEPWGWNPALIRRFKDNGVPEHYLPDDQQMTFIRNLAHRRTTVTLNTLWNNYIGKDFKVEVPVELKSEDACMGFYYENPGCWMKAPWSSSGRGVINTSADMTEELVRQWCHGILRRQGSVMGETGADRLADYATEWQLDQGQAIYLGLSSFNTSNRGKYISNQRKSQKEMIEDFDAVSLIRHQEVVHTQKNILEKVFAGYQGLLGVDMLIERNGKIRPFVEVNLRRTMGMLYIDS
ncbi:MAG: hypothetical protein K2K25_05940 [Muribaculaceae bacterium]|nr:hypothetical protein [Muribaculaceae bacterium]